jgi:site-specific DNA-methyltransferase (adenine-specific)
VPDGLGTALKPASEHWILARAPLACGTVADNVLAYGTGALEIDAGRIGTSGEDAARHAAEWNRTWIKRGGEIYGKDKGTRSGEGAAAGRWPANVALSHHDECNGVCHADCPVWMLGEQAGVRTSGKQAAGGHVRRSDKTRHSYGTFPGERCEGDALYGDSGSAARFFYVSKASRADRNEGLEGMPLKPNRGSGTHGNGQGDTRLANQSERASGITHVELNRVANHHPTVKSTDLMAWLIKLITPPGGTVLDPFMGSGSTGKAAVRLGRSFIGCELDADYYQIAARRIEAERAKHPLFAEAVS